MGMDYVKGKKYSSLDIAILNPIASNIEVFIYPNSALFYLFAS
jgi:hypothetical protein